MNWLNDYWKPKFGMIRPWLIATKDGKLLMDNDRDFRAPETYNLDFNYDNFPAWLKESKEVEID